MNKPLGDFKKVKSLKGHSTKCKACYKEYNQEYKKGDKGRAIRIKCLYGVTLEEVSKMYFLQNGKCKICGVPKPSSGYEGLHIDHDHVTGRVRGLLCNECNMMLGLAKDDTKILITAINYLNNEFRSI